MMERDIREGFVSAIYAADPECCLECNRGGVGSGGTDGEAGGRGRLRVARNNTRAEVIYSARCRRCFAQPDLDGEEYAGTEQEAYDIAWRDVGWVRTPEGDLLCDDCRPEDVGA